jgi:hypothetical protein
MLYTVTIEPSIRADGLPGTRSTVEAPDKDSALMQAEAAYRRMHPGTARLTLHVLRMREPGE